MRIHQKRIVNDKIQFQVLLKHYNQSSKKCGLVKWPNFYIGILLPTSLDHWTTVKVVPITTFSFPFHFGVAQCDFSPKHNQVGVEQRGLENKTTDATRMGFAFFFFKGNLLPERTLILFGHHQDKKRGEEEQGATDGSQQPLSTLCEKKRKKKQVQRDRCDGKTKRNVIK